MNKDTLNNLIENLQSQWNSIEKDGNYESVTIHLLPLEKKIIIKEVEYIGSRQNTATTESDLIVESKDFYDHIKKNVPNSNLLKMQFTNIPPELMEIGQLIDKI